MTTTTLIGEGICIAKPGLANQFASSLLVMTGFRRAPMLAKQLTGRLEGSCDPKSVQSDQAACC
jgi:hypothetical protein